MLVLSGGRCLSRDQKRSKKRVESECLKINGEKRRVQRAKKSKRERKQITLKMDRERKKERKIS